MGMMLFLALVFQCRRNFYALPMSEPLSLAAFLPFQLGTVVPSHAQLKVLDLNILPTVRHRSPLSSPSK